MSEASLTSLISELQAAEAQLVDLIAGDIALYNSGNSGGLQPASINALSDARGTMERRSHLLRAAIMALVALDADGYPTHFRAIVDAIVLRDMQDQIARMSNAFHQFGGDQARSLGIDQAAAVSTPQPVPTT